MTETVEAKPEDPKQTRQEQIDTMLPMMQKMMPSIVEVATLYHKAYPINTTAPEVIDVVTVSLPLRHFMLMAAIISNLCVIAQEKVAGREAADIPDASGQVSR